MRRGEDDRDGSLVCELDQRRTQTLFCQRPRMYTLREASKIAARSVKLGRERDQRSRRVALSAPGECRKAARYVAEIPFGAGPQLLPEVTTLRIAGRYKPAA